MGYCEKINCGYWYKNEEDSFPCCHHEDDFPAPCEQDEEEEE